MGSHRTITIMGNPVRKEYTAAGAITPGMLLKLGSAGTVVAHSDESGNAPKMFALEDELQGKEISQAYSSGDLVLCGIFRPGDEVNALLATSQTIVIGDLLESNGAGYLKKHAPDPEESEARKVQEGVIAMALEAVTTTSSASRIRVEIM
jgi:hypothetical protein